MDSEDKGILLVLDVSQTPTLEKLEREYINLVLKNTGGNKALTAKLLGVSTKTIYNKLDEYKIDSTNVEVAK